MVSSGHPPPVRLRPATERAIGTTAFFRNRPLFEVLLEEMKAAGGDYYRVLFHACSIGAEVYSFVIQYALGGYVEDFIIEVHASDLEPGFVEFARQGVFPADILAGMREEEQSFFEPVAGGVAVVADLRQVVSFGDAVSYLDFDAETPLDVVLLLNTLIYVPREQQALAIDRVAGYNSGWLVATAFHMDTIRADLARNGYAPVRTRQREIHDAWVDRRVPGETADLPDGTYADWRLPAFSEIDDFEYRYCAVFRRGDSG